MLTGIFLAASVAQAGPPPPLPERPSAHAEVRVTARIIEAELIDFEKAKPQRYVVSGEVRRLIEFE
jgi:hypothetical protein